MAEFPALPLWTDAYLGDTTHLTTIEHGAYLLLLMTAWRTRDCALPDDDRLLARYARLNAQQWKRMRPILEPFFRVEDGKWRQGRLTDERGAVERHRQQQSEKGKAGAVAKSLKRRERDKAGAKSGLEPAEAEVQPDASSHLHTHIPLDKSNGATDPEKVMFDAGISMLTGQGKTETAARSLLGKWKRDHGTGEVIEMLGAAQRLAVVDLAGWAEGRWRAGAEKQAAPIC